MRLLDLRLLPLIAITLAACTNKDGKDDTDTVVTDDIDDTDTNDTDVVKDTDDTDPVIDTDTEDTDSPYRHLSDLAAGDLVITEFMSNPLACADPNGEYIEIFYKGDQALDLNGLVLSTEGSSIANTQTTIVQPNSYALLVRQSAAANCYGLLGDWTYSIVSLVDAGDTITLSYGAVTFDTVDYRGAGWSEMVPGAAVGFGGETPDATANDNPQAWCNAPVLYTLGGTDDRGHPRAETACEVDGSDTDADSAPADLMLTEIMDYGPDASIRYVEIYNPGSDPVSLDGWFVDIYRDGSPSGNRIALTASAMLPAGETWVLASPTTTAPVLANSNLQISSGCGADQYSADVNMDGNDAITLNYNGFVVDVYGVPGVNGFGKSWAYGDKVAYRQRSLRSPSILWTSGEWTVTNTWLQASVCRFDEDYVEDDTDSGDSFQNTYKGFETDTFDTNGFDSGEPHQPNPLSFLAPGDLVITEIMINPTCGHESQYIEIMLLAPKHVDLAGLTLQIGASSTQFVGNAEMRIGSTFLLWRTPTGQPDANCYFGASAAGFRYSDMDIAESGSIIRLKAGALVLDSVDTTGMYPYAGNAWQFNSDLIILDTANVGTLNNDVANWCSSADPISGSSDVGSPGFGNVCADSPDTDVMLDTDVDTDPIDTGSPIPEKLVPALVVGDLTITEFMAEPFSPCTAVDGEYIEIRNNTSSRVNLNGLVVTTNSGSGVIGARKIVLPGAYALLYRTPVTTQCFHFDDGGATRAINYPAGIAIAQAGDNIRIGNASITLDTVDFTAWTTTAPAGTAWSLSDLYSTPASNDDQTHWCTSGSFIGAGNIGTPGNQPSCAAP